MSEREIKKLAREGWVIECQSPLEIRHEESGSFATGLAAQIVIEVILSNAGWSDL